MFKMFKFHSIMHSHYWMEQLKWDYPRVSASALLTFWVGYTLGLSLASALLVLVATLPTGDNQRLKISGLYQSHRFVKNETKSRNTSQLFASANKDDITKFMSTSISSAAPGTLDITHHLWEVQIQCLPIRHSVYAVRNNCQNLAGIYSCVCIARFRKASISNYFIF